MFNSILGSTLTFTSVSLCILSALGLGIMSAFAYMKSGKYSKEFVTSLVLLPMLVAVVLMMVNGSLGTSIAVLGAFSLIRFRSEAGSAKEITYIFLAMAIGLSVGMGQVVFAALITIVSNIVLYLLYVIKFGNNSNKYLKILIPEILDYEDVFTDILNKYTSYYELVKVKTTNLGSLYELTYEVRMKNDKELKNMLDDLRVKNGNLKVMCERSIVNEGNL